MALSPVSLGHIELWRSRTSASLSRQLLISVLANRTIRLSRAASMASNTLGRGRTRSVLCDALLLVSLSFAVRLCASYATSEWARPTSTAARCEPTVWLLGALQCCTPGQSDLRNALGCSHVNVKCRNVIGSCHQRSVLVQYTSFALCRQMTLDACCRGGSCTPFQVPKMPRKAYLRTLPDATSCSHAILKPLL